MKIPTITAPIAETKTAEAEISLIIPISLLKFGSTKFANFSMAVLKSSATKTAKQTITTIEVSKVFN